MNACNILDPLDDVNNLAMGVSRASLKAITAAFGIGSRDIESVISSTIATGTDCDRKAWSYPPSHSTLDFLCDIFPSCYALYGVPKSMYHVHSEARRNGLALRRPVVTKLSSNVLRTGVKHNEVYEGEIAFDGLCVKHTVEGSGFRADLLDHPRQPVPSVSSAVEKGEKAEESSSSSLGYRNQECFDSLDGALTGDLGLMLRDMRSVLARTRSKGEGGTIAAGGEGRHTPADVSPSSAAPIGYKIDTEAHSSSCQSECDRKEKTAFSDVLRRDGLARSSGSETTWPPSFARANVPIMWARSPGFFDDLPLFKISSIFIMTALFVPWLATFRQGQAIRFVGLCAWTPLLQNRWERTMSETRSFFAHPLVEKDATTSAIEAIFANNKTLNIPGVRAEGMKDILSARIHMRDQQRTQWAAPFHERSQEVCTRSGGDQGMEDESAPSHLLGNLLSVEAQWVLAGEGVILGDMTTNVYSGRVPELKDWQFRWLKDGLLLRGGTYEAPYIVLRNVSLEQEGTYTCQVRRSPPYLAPLWKSTLLGTEHMPKAMKKQQQKFKMESGDEGDNERTCRKVRKRRSRRNQKSSATEIEEIKPVQAINQVDAHSTRPGRRGVILFEAEESVNMYSSSSNDINPWVNWLTATLLVAIPPAVPQGLMVHEDVKEGQTLRLRVPNATGVPRLRYQWKHSGFDVPGAVSRTLVVHEVRRRHSGTYTCRVWNTVGEVEWSEAVVTVRTNRSPAKPYVHGEMAGALP